MEACDTLDIPCHLGNGVEYAKEFVLWLWEQILLAVTYVLNLIPVPDWTQNTDITLPDGVLWVVSVFEIQYGVTVMVSAITLRFIIRRIPFIG